MTIITGDGVNPTIRLNLIVLFSTKFLSVLNVAVTTFMSSLYRFFFLYENDSDINKCFIQGIITATFEINDENTFPLSHLNALEKLA